MRRSPLLPVMLATLVACGAPPPREAPGRPRAPEPSGDAATDANSDASRARTAPLPAVLPPTPAAEPHTPAQRETAVAPGEAQAHNDSTQRRSGETGGPGLAPTAEPPAAGRPASAPIDRAALQSAIDALVAAPELAGLALGVALADGATGELLAAHEGDKLLNPASNEKLPTTATALLLLGAEHHFEATVHLGVDGAVVLCGGGDPGLTQSALATLADATVSALGTVKVRTIVVDETGFTGSALPPGYDKKTTDAAYRAATAMTAVDEATYRLTLSPTRIGAPVKVELSPPGDHVTIDNRGKTVAGKTRRIGVESSLANGKTSIVVRGKLGVDATQRPVAVRRVEDPAAVAGAAFRAALAQRGVAVGAKVSVQRSGAVTRGKLLASHSSPPLSELVARINKTSSNFGAEMLLRAIAVSESAAGRGAPDWDTGIAAVMRVATSTLGLSPKGLAVHNGSGLYDGGRISATSLTRLLVAMQRTPAGVAFDGSLSVAGVDGTLAGRLKGPSTLRRFRGKTGTLDDVSSLAGYLPTRSGRLLAVAIIVNGRFKSAGPIRKAQDRLITQLAELP